MENKKLTENLQQMKQLIEECLSEVGEKHSIKLKQSKVVRPSSVRGNLKLDFSMSPRAFIKRYAKGMGGPKKFTLLLAYLTKCDANKIIKLEEIKKYWSKGLFGGKINSFYSTQAKSNDWIDSRKKEEYSLRPSWRDIF